MKNALLLFTLVFAFSTSACTTKQAVVQEMTSTERVKVLIVSGQNNHDWQRTNNLLIDVLNDANKFETDISLTPPKGSAPEAWDSWNPRFTAYQVILMDYNGEMWPERVKANFEQFVMNGGKVLAQHASNNPFPGWSEFEQMIGILWRNPADGDRVFYNDQGTMVREERGVGLGAGHGEKHDWTIRNRKPAHPVMNGVPLEFLHPFDELYHGQRGPAENMEVLATAYSREDNGGSGKHELMIWTIPFGQGTVMTFLPGHLWPEQEDTSAFHCIGFRTLLTRSLEWLGTGEVTIPIPPNFPTKDRISMVE